jgi:hypothetical protein
MMAEPFETDLTFDPKWMPSQKTPRRMRSHSHLGTHFEVWTAQQTWFWSLVNPHRNGGAIGAAASEAEAVREATLLIEAISGEPISGQQRAGATSALVTGKNASGLPLALCGWKVWLTNLERYLACLNRETA